METLPLLAFALAMSLSMAIPGPTITTLLARIIARGTPGILPFCIGLVVGDVLWLGAAVFGLSVLAQTAQPVFAVLKWAGVAYLLFLAWKLWTAPAVAPAEAQRPTGNGWRAFGGAVMLNLGNPKVMVFYTALAPAVIDLTQVTVLDFAGLAAILAAVFSAILAGYVLLASRARRLVRNARAVRRVNRAAGVTMAGAAAAVAAR